MPTTYKPRKKVKQSVRQSVKQTQKVVVNIQTPARRVSRPRATKQVVSKALLTRPTPPAVITIPQGVPALPFDLMRSIANQEKTVQELLEKQALLTSKLNNISFTTNQEGVLLPEVSQEEKAELAEQLKSVASSASASITALEDTKRKESPLAFKPVPITPTSEGFIGELRARVGKAPSEIREEVRAEKLRETSPSPEPSPERSIEPEGAGAPTPPPMPKRGRPPIKEGEFTRTQGERLRALTEAGQAMTYNTLVEYGRALGFTQIPKGMTSQTDKGRAMRLGFQRQLIAKLRREGFYED